MHENEPRVTPGLLDLPNVVLLPHIGSATIPSRDGMARAVAPERELAEVRSARLRETKLAQQQAILATMRTIGHSFSMAVVTLVVSSEIGNVSLAAAKTTSITDAMRDSFVPGTR